MNLNNIQGVSERYRKRDKTFKSTYLLKYHYYI